MLARYIFSALAVIFIVLALRARRHGVPAAARVRTWMTIGVIFALVSLWLWSWR